MKGIKRRLAMCLLTVLMVLIALTGCVKANITVEITKDGKVNASILYSYSEQLAAYADDMEGSIDANEFKEMGWNVNPYNEDGYTGYRMNIEGASIKDLGNSSSSLTGDLQVKKNGSNYKILWPISSIKGDIDADTATTIKGAGGYFTFVLKLPVKPESHNASSVSEDGKTLTWDLLSMKDNAIECEFKLNLFNPLILICILLVVAAIAAILVLKKKKTSGDTGMPGDGSADGISSVQNDSSVGDKLNGVLTGIKKIAPAKKKICQDCGAEIDGNAEFCTKCGSRYIPPKPKACGSCGAILGEEDMFCPKCGTKYAEQIDTSIVCPHCQGKNEENAVFCEHCGKRITEEI